MFEKVFSDFFEKLGFFKYILIALGAVLTIIGAYWLFVAGLVKLTLLQ